MRCLRESLPYAALQAPEHSDEPAFSQLSCIRRFKTRHCIIVLHAAPTSPSPSFFAPTPMPHVAPRLITEGTMRRFRLLHHPHFPAIPLDLTSRTTLHACYMHYDRLCCCTGGGCRCAFVFVCTVCTAITLTVASACSLVVAAYTCSVSFCKRCVTEEEPLWRRVTVQLRVPMALLLVTFKFVFAEARQRNCMLHAEPFLYLLIRACSVIINVFELLAMMV